MRKKKKTKKTKNPERESIKVRWDPQNEGPRS